MKHPEDVETQGNIINLVGGWGFGVLRKCRCGKYEGESHN